MKKPYLFMMFFAFILAAGTITFININYKDNEMAIQGIPFPFEFDNAEAIVYNYKSSSATDLVLPSGEINNAIQRIKLKKEQLNEISAAILHRSDPNFIGLGCYIPHHGILFFKDQSLIGYYEVCLTCRGDRYMLPNMKESYFTDYDALKLAFKNIGLYIGNETIDYDTFEANNKALTSHYTGESHE